MTIRPFIHIPLLALFCFTTAFTQEKGGVVQIQPGDGVVYSMCFTENGEELAVTSDQAVYVYSMQNAVLLNEFTGGHTGQVMSVDISFDNTLMVSGGKDSTVVIWDFTGTRIIETLRHHQGIVTTVQLSPDCRYLATGGTDARIFLYDMMENKVIREFTMHDDDVTSVVFSPDGKWLASSGADKLIFLYDVEAGGVVDSLAGHKSWVRSLSFNRDGTRLLSCGDDGRVITWNLDDPVHGYLQYKTRISSTWLIALDVRGDDWVYACGDLDGKACVVTPLGTYRASVGAPVTRILFHPGEPVFMKIAIATRGNGVVLMDGKNMKWNMRKRSR